MTIDRVNPADWGVGETLTSAQLNALDENASFALDKRAGETDTLESVVALATTGRIVPSVAAGADSNSTILVGSGNSVLRVSGTFAANRDYTLSATGASTNDVISVFCEASFNREITIKDQAAATLYVLGNTDNSDGQWAQFIYIGGWRLLQRGVLGRVRRQVFTANGTWTCPPGVLFAEVEGCGGGGGGGGGLPSQGSTKYASGGGGGGGALAVRARVAVTPGSIYSVGVGAGGAGAVATNVWDGTANDGADGADSTFDVLLTMPGGAGGKAGTVTTSNYSFGMGGPPTKPAESLGLAVSADRDTHRTYGIPGYGGTGVGGNNATPRNGSKQGPASGGAAGTNNTTTGGGGGTYKGGGSGGGGGAGGGYVAGVTSTGGAGGNGGDAGSDVLPPTVGTSGAAGAANSGAGGGGGGAAGSHGYSDTFAGGAGGAGGSGVVVVTWVK